MRRIQVIFTILTLGVIVLLSGCSDMPIKPGGLEPPRKLWETSLAEDGELVGSVKPIVYKDMIIVSRWQFDSPNEPLLAFNKNNGSYVWQWNDHFHDAGIFGFTRNMHIFNNYLVLASSHDVVYAIDMAKGESIWTSYGSIEHGKDITGLDEYIFSVERKETRSNLFMSTVYSPEWNEILTYHTSDNWLPKVKPPTIVKNAQNELLAIFWLLWSDQSSSDVKPYIVCYNISKQIVVYETRLSMSLDVRAGVHEIPNISEERIFLVLDDELICIDLVSGDILWRNKFSQSKLGGDTFAQGDYVVAATEDQHLYSFDADTGHQRWKQYIGGGTQVFKYYNRIIYLVSTGDHHLYAIDEDTGEYIWDFESPLQENVPGAFFNYLIALDEENETLFVMNYVNLECYELIK